MQKLKLIRLLKTLSEDELNSFEKYLQSPYFESKPFQLNFFHELQAFYPEYPTGEIQKNKLFSKLYPGKKYDDRIVRKLTSILTNHLENFLILERLKQDTVKKNRLLVEQLFLRQLPEFRDTLVSESLQYLSEEVHTKPILIIDHAEMCYLKFGFSFANLNVVNEELLDDLYASSTTDMILFKMFDTLYQISSYKKRLNISSQNNLDHLLNSINIDSFIKKYEKSKGVIKELVLISMYVLSVYIKDDNDEDYRKLKKLVLTKFDKFDYGYSLGLFHKMQNFCVVKSNQGRTEYQKELFELYDFYFYKSAAPSHKEFELHPLFIRNTFKCAIYNAKIKWAERFIKDFIKYVEPKFRENNYNLFMSELKFETKEFNESLSYHSKINFDVLIQKFDYKHLHLKLLYELGYIEEAIYALNSAKQFLKGKSDVPEIQSVYFKNALKYYSKLLNLKSGKDKKTSLEFILHNLQKEKNIHKKWFEKKLRDLMSVNG